MHDSTDEKLGPVTDHQGHTTPVPEDETEVWVSGGTMFAGVLLLVTGVFGMLTGISGIATDDVYGAVGEDYMFKFDIHTWGWVHLVLGVVVALTGIGILQGIAWARITGTVMAVLVMVANFMWLPYQPVWAVIAIVIALFVIWSLTTSLSRTDPR
ncbi:DUF7144 family membrane protein [Streptomyces iconiensis]|uniref:DUF7144 domain-containing protein n=1 Tax=Streptomyces iconiensis TaxID=1384038 RepID=A0ABT7A6I8_9ACTN|nr:hypothetical protein [Streptomyces iconiensis]MDJ1136644.1 hypothetical protein [Streptomyces iconiensis]